jgi:hypothetical protein
MRANLAARSRAVKRAPVMAGGAASRAPGSGHRRVARQHHAPVGVGVPGPHQRSPLASPAGGVPEKIPASGSKLSHEGSPETLSASASPSG